MRVVRKFLIAAAALLGLIFIVTRFTEMEKIALTLQNGDWHFVLLAALTEIAWLWLIGRTYHTIYRLLGIPSTPRHMFSLASAANFASVIAPSGGMSSMAVMLADARANGQPAARVTVANLIYILCEYLGVLGAFALGIVVLLRRNNMNWPALLAAALLALLALCLGILLYLAMTNPQKLGRILAWLVRAGNRVLHPFIHREYFHQEQAHDFACEAAEGLALMRTHSAWSITRPVLLSITNKFILMLILALIFMAFRIPFSPGTLVAGFSISYLFVIVSPTPGGIGIFEGILTIWLRALGVGLEPAAVITLAYRGVTFWQPLIIGGYMFRRFSKTAAPDSVQ